MNGDVDIVFIGVYKLLKPAIIRVSKDLNAKTTRDNSVDNQIRIYIEAMWIK